MPEFTIESRFQVPAETLARDLLNIAAVNSELKPYFKMTAPSNWMQRDVRKWPTDKALFKSLILLFGRIPIDLHYFQLAEVLPLGIRERSTTLMNRSWHHDRIIEPLEKGCRLRDTVRIEPRLKAIRPIAAMAYKAVFEHRHRQLRKKYRVYRESIGSTEKQRIEQDRV